jgi:S-adenosylmethionine hydrolase
LRRATGVGFKIITLLTDFGLTDHYAASVKGAILGICPEATIVDISHMVPPQDIRSGAYLLKCVYKDFPKGTIHIAVVDPGVGSARRGLAIATGTCFFVGPDNGIFSLVLTENPSWSAHSIENRSFWRTAVCNTFHGRDVFAPAAAHLANGTPLGSMGPTCTPLSPDWTITKILVDELLGEVIHIDHFGNCITNITYLDIKSFGEKQGLSVHVRLNAINAISDHYAEAKPGETMALIGSCNHLEIAVNQGNAAIRLGIESGEKVSVRKRTQGSQ